MNTSDYALKAAKLVTEAVNADNEGNVKLAFDMYMQSFTWFELAIKYEQNPFLVNRIKARLLGYLDRAEELKPIVTAMQAERRYQSEGVANAPIASGASGDADHDESSKRMSEIESAILTERPNVSWSDVAGLEVAKMALKETVIMPILFPKLFSDNAIEPWKGILLYGPPGTGKSYLAKAVATEAKMTFFSVSASRLTSKWVGESEKLVRSLFEMARSNKPSIVFIDEIDSLCSSRDDGGGAGGGGGGERMKTEFLVQMQGVGNNQDGVLVLGATNLPWTLDAAIRRRFERRIYIPLPDTLARKTIFRQSVPVTVLSDEQCTTLASLTDGYSGADIAVIARDAKFQPVRTFQLATHFAEVESETGSLLTPCPPDTPDAIQMTWDQVPENLLLAPRVSYNDFILGVQSTRPSVGQSDIDKHVSFTNDFGIDGV